MIKGKGIDLTDQINRSFSRELQAMLEKVFTHKLKSVHASLDTLHVEQKKQCKAIKNIQKTLDIAIKNFDNEDVLLHRRVQKIETHLGL